MDPNPSAALAAAISEACSAVGAFIDRDHGGFFYEIDPQGAPANREKALEENTIALWALSHRSDPALAPLRSQDWLDATLSGFWRHYRDDLSLETRFSQDFSEVVDPSIETAKLDDLALGLLRAFEVTGDERWARRCAEVIRFAERRCGLPHEPAPLLAHVPTSSDGPWDLSWAAVKHLWVLAECLRLMGTDRRSEVLERAAAGVPPDEALAERGARAAVGLTTGRLRAGLQGLYRILGARGAGFRRGARLERAATGGLRITGIKPDVKLYGNSIIGSLLLRLIDRSNDRDLERDVVRWIDDLEAFFDSQLADLEHGGWFGQADVYPGDGPEAPPQVKASGGTRKFSVALSSAVVFLSEKLAHQLKRQEALSGGAHSDDLVASVRRLDVAVHRLRTLGPACYQTYNRDFSAPGDTTANLRLHPQYARLLALWAYEDLQSNHRAALDAARIRIELLMSKRIFLSHKRVDRPPVQKLRDVLRTLGFDPWLDTDDIRVGDALAPTITQGFEQSCACVFFITPDFRPERYLKQEIALALARHEATEGRFRIICLRMLNAAGERGNVPKALRGTLTIERHYGDPDSDLEALHLILRALPLNVGEVSWRP